MRALEAFAFLIIGFCFGVWVVLFLQKERAFTAVRHLKMLGQSLRQLLAHRNALQLQIAAVKQEIRQLERSIMRLRNEREALELAWNKAEIALQSTNRVSVEEAIVFGRGQEWVYLYTFPAHDQLAHARQQTHYPMKLGMSAQANVVDRVHQQVSGNSTAISERAVVRLVFRVNSSRQVEAWMHDFSKEKWTSGVWFGRNGMVQHKSHRN